MNEPVFFNRVSQDFWLQVRDMPRNHQEIILELLSTLDIAASESSVRNRFPARGAWDLQGRVTLLEHSIHVSTICRQLASGTVVEKLAVIAGLGHDIGKLPELHAGRYAEIMHAHWSAEHVRTLVFGRLIAVQAEAVVNAIRYHHIAYEGNLVNILRSADGRARGEELLAVVDQRRSQ